MLYIYQHSNLCHRLWIVHNICCWKDLQKLMIPTNGNLKVIYYFVSWAWSYSNSALTVCFAGWQCCCWHIKVLLWHEFSIVPHDETLNHKPHFLLWKCAKTLQHCRISKFSGGGPPDPLLTGGRGRGGKEREGGGGTKWGELCFIAIGGMDAPVLYYMVLKESLCDRIKQT